MRTRKHEESQDRGTGRDGGPGSALCEYVWMLVSWSLVRNSFLEWHRDRDRQDIEKRKQDRFISHHHVAKKKKT
jgi:hypothetical protein